MKKVAVSALGLFLIAFIGLSFYFFLKFPFAKVARSSGELAGLSVSSSTSSSASILFVGDIMLGRHVETLMDENGADYPFRAVEPLLEGNSLVVANLEGPIVSDHIHTADFSFDFSFPTTSGEILAKNHIGLVTLANNHTYNAGPEGFQDTQSFLTAAGVSYVGSPVSVGPESVLVKQVGEFKVAFVGLNFTESSLDKEKAAALVASTSAAADYTIVLIHGGTEYALHSNTDQETFYRSLIDAGAGLIIGAHPHVVEEVEEYKGHLIFYSLGNFIFDQYFSPDVQEELAVRLTLSRPSNISGSAIVSSSTTIAEYFNLVPLMSNQSQPALMSFASSTAWLAELASRSDPVLAGKIEQGEIVIQ